LLWSGSGSYRFWDGCWLRSSRCSRYKGGSRRHPHNVTRCGGRCMSWCRGARTAPQQRTATSTDNNQCPAANAHLRIPPLPAIPGPETRTCPCPSLCSPLKHLLPCRDQPLPHATTFHPFILVILAAPSRYNNNSYCPVKPVYATRSVSAMIYGRPRASRPVKITRASGL